MLLFVLFERLRMRIFISPHDELVEPMGAI
jgi:hypothetical protein